MFLLVVILSTAVYFGLHAYRTFVGARRTPVQDLLKNPKYDLKSIQAPKLAGKLFLFVVNFLELAPFGDVLVPLILKSSGFSILDETSMVLPPVLYPVPERSEEEIYRDVKYFEESGKLSCQELHKMEIERIANDYMNSDLAKDKLIYSTAIDYHRKYLEKSLTPTQVAKNILESIKKRDNSNHPLLAVIKYDEKLLLDQAKESTTRYEQGNPISVFDGVFLTIKDELDLNGFTTSKGMKITRFTERVINIDEESNLAKSFRSLGAIFVGKANQNEIGICARGLNVNFGSARNPYNLKCDTGGSSSGSGAGVGSGLVPISIGTDGGGSVRIPSSLCGVWGLKPTHFTISGKQTSQSVAFSTCVAGPLAGSAIDLTLGFAALSGRRENDIDSQKQPRDLKLNQIKLSDPNFYSLAGKKIGIHTELFEDVKDQRIVKLCRDFIQNVFCSVYGAEIDESLKIPLLEVGRVAHLVSIAGEMRNGMNDYGYSEYSIRSQLCPETRMSLLSQQYVSSSQYISAQRVRAHQMEELKKIFEKVEVIATPTVACIAPQYDDEQCKKGGLGVSDYDVLSSVMKFIYISNFCGIPSVNIPIGFVDGLPVGLQLMGKWWDDAVLLKYCLLAQKYVEKKEPELKFNLMSQ